MKIAFDFDGTLERNDVQILAKEIIDLGYHVEIVTTRWDEDNKHKYRFWGKLNYDKDNFHGDLYKVAGELKISYNFTNMQWKSEFLKINSFDVLVDDNYKEKFLVEESGIRFVPVDKIKEFIKELKNLEI
jgi:hypothetical protein